MSTFKNVYSIDRKEAGERLKVSLRTLDRYIGAGALNFQRERGRIRLCEAEILEFQKKRSQFFVNFSPKPRTKILKPEKEVPLKESRGHSTLPSSEKIFQQLYIDLRLEVKEQQKRLEGANYRVGQLEAQLKNSVPLLEYHAESLKLAEKQAKLLFEKEKVTREATFSRAQFELRNLRNALFTEKINKWAYMVVLFLVLLAQPILWFLMKT
ncbi:helix-turn-helix domain-containing protein [Candidatus Peregrinibacteria bacterium]|nr:helix-turn-helix domain-containing protein [Candidatus Peregrinibacteria bacterium]